MYVFDEITKFVKGLVEGLSGVSNFTLNLHLHFDSPAGVVPPVVVEEPGEEEPGGELPVDPRPKSVVYAKAKPDKEHVNLWIKVGMNNVPVEDGGPYMILDHQPLGERDQVPDKAKIIILSKEIRINGGEVAFGVLGYGWDDSVFDYPLDGKGLYIKRGEFTTE